ncbi:hypothetical protein GF337_09290, partial [candidate division KSB1 bacterium]|nr:hypothetical protein [candidate division KSB1 bacterium]
MMQRKYIFTIITFLVMISPVLVTGQDQTIDYGIEPADYERVGQSGYQFLKIPTNARTAAMGGIATAVGHGDASSALANPASIADVDDSDISLTRINWFADIGYQSGSVVKNFGRWGHFGVHFIYLDYGDMIRNEYNEVFDNGVSTGRAEIALDQGTFGAHDLAIGLTYSRQV